mmetsp:Transcript_62804/g.144648  ORF Transcript_62804/g.144648 Transcript_62804/m.144648 type:complete len:213 (-) Transcript_62804:190-828(-)
MRQQLDPHGGPSGRRRAVQRCLTKAIYCPSINVGSSQQASHTGLVAMTARQMQRGGLKIGPQSMIRLKFNQQIHQLTLHNISAASRKHCQHWSCSFRIPGIGIGTKPQQNLGQLHQPLRASVMQSALAAGGRLLHIGPVLQQHVGHRPVIGLAKRNVMQRCGPHDVRGIDIRLRFNQALDSRNFVALCFNSYVKWSVHLDVCFCNQLWMPLK